MKLTDRRTLDAIAAGDAPCGRCLTVCESEGLLAEHLTREHLMGDDQARYEARESATGISRAEDGRCRGCNRREGHGIKCVAVQRALRAGYRLEGPIQIVVDGVPFAPKSIAEAIEFLRDLEALHRPTPKATA